MNLASPDDHVPFLKRLMVIGKSMYVVATYFELSSGPIHESVLAKFCDAFFGAVSPVNPLSTTSDATKEQMVDFSGNMYIAKEYDTCDEYSKAWRAACTIARLELLAAANTAS